VVGCEGWLACPIACCYFVAILGILAILVIIRHVLQQNEVQQCASPVLTSASDLSCVV
jgi:hypothetical protein